MLTPFLSLPGQLPGLVSVDLLSRATEQALALMGAASIDPARLGAFIVLTTGFALTPGPAVLFAIATGMAHGKKAGLSGIAGINAGSTLWFIGAAFGLGALIHRWPLAFRVMAWLGVAYIFWLGARSLYGAWKSKAGLENARPARPGIAFRDGLLVQVFNPKALLFFAVILPPFIDPSAPAAGQFILLGVVAIGIDIVVLSAYALAGGYLGAQMRSPGFRRGFMVAVGLVLIGSGCLVALRIPG